MKRIRRLTRISLAVSSTLLTLVNLLKLAPWNGKSGYFWNYFQSFLMNNPIWEKRFLIFIVVLGAIVVLSTILDLQKDQKIKAFKTDSKKFEKYFAKWYSKKGHLNIICDDLDNWVTFPIREALLSKSKAGALNLFIAKPSPKSLVKELKKAGATIKGAPADIVTNYSFSCITYMGGMTMAIIRDKHKDDSGKIKFEEIPHSYSTDLLNTLIGQLLKNGEDINV